MTFRPFLVGRIVKRVRTDHGDFFVILAEGETSKRFRADANLFTRPDEIGPDALVSFYPADKSAKRTSKTLPRVQQIVFQPETGNLKGI